MDFSTVGIQVEAACTIIDAALAAAGGAVKGLALTGHSPKRIEYQGPLGRPRFLKLDITDDEIVLSVSSAQLLTRWRDLPSAVMVPAYSIHEIAGEKLRCLMQRLQCRDLYDLWFLSEHADLDLHEVIEIFKRKALHRNLDPSDFRKKYEARLRQYKDRWIRELEIHLRGPIPHFERVERTVSRKLRRTEMLQGAVDSRPTLRSEENLTRPEPSKSAAISENPVRAGSCSQVSGLLTRFFVWALYR